MPSGLAAIPSAYSSTLRQIAPGRNRMAQEGFTLRVTGTAERREAWVRRVVVSCLGCALFRRQGLVTRRP